MGSAQYQLCGLRQMRLPSGTICRGAGPSWRGCGGRCEGAWGRDGDGCTPYHPRGLASSSSCHSSPQVSPGAGFGPQGYIWQGPQMLLSPRRGCYWHLWVEAAAQGGSSAEDKRPRSLVPHLRCFRVQMLLRVGRRLSALWAQNAHVNVQLLHGKWGSRRPSEPPASIQADLLGCYICLEGMDFCLFRGTGSLVTVSAISLHPPHCHLLTGRSSPSLLLTSGRKRTGFSKT